MTRFMVCMLCDCQCPMEECRGRIFTPLRSSDLTQTIDWQTIRCAYNGVCVQQ